MKRLLLLVLASLALLAACTGLPTGVKPVSGFQAERYLGTWYEIARLDHSSSAACRASRPNTASATTAASR